MTTREVKIPNIHTLKKASMKHLEAHRERVKQIEIEQYERFRERVTKEMRDAARKGKFRIALGWMDFSDSIKFSLFREFCEDFSTILNSYGYETIFEDHRRDKEARFFVKWED